MRLENPNIFLPSVLLFLVSVPFVFLGCQLPPPRHTVTVDGQHYPKTGAGVNAAIRDAGSNSEVVLQPGTYKLDAPIIIDGLRNITVRISDAEILANPADFNGAISMLSITRSSYVSILGEKKADFNGFGTPRDCVTINAPGLADSIPVSHVRVSGLSCRGTLDGIDAGDSKTFKMNTQEIEIDHNVVDHTSGPGQINVQATIGADIHDNTLDHPAPGQDQIVCSTDLRCQVHSNIVRGFVPPLAGNPQAAINGFFCQACSWHDNVIYGVTSAVPSGFGFGDMYCDTCFDSQITHNELIGGMWGITCEICRNVLIRANLLVDQLNTGIQFFGSTLFRSINHLNSVRGLKSGAGVVLSEEPRSPAARTHALQAHLSADFSRGVIFEQDITPPLQPDLGLQIQSSRELPAAALGFQYCSGPQLQGTCTILEFGTIPAGVWISENPRFPVKQPFDNYQSYAIVALKDLPSTALSFQDLEADRIAEYCSIETNHIIRPRIWGVSIYEGTQHYSIIQNQCDQVGYDSEGEFSGCVIISDADEGDTSYVLRYGTVEGNQATSDAGAAAAYGIRAYALGRSINDSLLVWANRWNMSNRSFFSHVTNLIFGPSLQFENACAPDSSPIAEPHNGCGSRAPEQQP